MTRSGHDSSALGVLLQNGLLYAVDGAGLVVVKPNNGKDAQLVKRLDLGTDGTFRSIAGSGNTLICGYRGGFQVIDVTNPVEPALLKTIPSDGDGTVTALHMEGTTLYATGIGFDSTTWRIG